MKRVAIAGMGYMGRTHLGVYLGMSGVRVEALFDSREEALNPTSLDAGGNIATSSGAVDLSGVRRFTDYGKLLDAGGFDFVDVCLPTHLHADHVVRALEHVRRPSIGREPGLSRSVSARPRRLRSRGCGRAGRAGP